MCGWPPTGRKIRATAGFRTKSVQFLRYHIEVWFDSLLRGKASRAELTACSGLILSGSLASRPPYVAMVSRGALLAANLLLLTLASACASPDTGVVTRPARSARSGTLPTLARFQGG